MEPARRILRRLGVDGIRLIIGRLVDRRTLVRTAKACRLTYPGKRTPSVPSARLVSDLAKKVFSEPFAATELLRALDEACAGAILLVEGTEPGALRRLARTEPAGPREGAGLLYALAGDPRREAAAAASIVRKRLEEAGEARRTAEALPRAGGASRDGASRPRDRVARLERGRASAGVQDLARLSADLRHALRDMEKAVHRLRGLMEGRAPSAADPSGPHLEAVASSVRSLQRLLAEIRRERKAERRKDLEAIADLAREVRATRSELAAIRSGAAARPQRRKGEPARAGLFVDVQNMYYAARQLNARLDFGALREEVSRDRRLVRAIAYVVENPEIDQSGFLAMLAQRNYEVRRKTLKTRADGSSKGDWDLGMALEIMRLAENLDVVVLASGDGDFVPLVNQIKIEGPLVEVFSFPGSTAKELREACDRHVAIGDALLIRQGVDP